MFRTVTIATVAMAISLGSHLVADGAVPGTGALVVGFTITLLLGLNTSSRRYTFARAFVVLVATQPLLHVLFAAGAHNSHLEQDVSTSLTSAHSFEATMVGAHVIAAILVAAWIAQGESLLWRWMGQVWWQIVRPLSTVDVLCPPTAGRLPSVARWDAFARLTGSVSHRGPPFAV